MAILFPGGLDNFTNPSAADNLNTPAVLHSDQHANENDAIEALEAKVGVDGSLVTGSFDYRINYLEGNQHSPVTLGVANGLSLSGQQLSMGLAGANATGTLSATDWNTFNSKQGALTFPLASSLGGSGVNNSGTFTHQSNTIVTGGGTVALGGFTLTVPATGTAALLATANVFTVPQTIAGSTNATQFVIKANGTQSTPIMSIQKSDGTAWLNVDSDDVSNVFIGVDTGRFNTVTGVGNQGKFNIFIGNFAGYTNSTGSNNFALGSSALELSVAGVNNVAIGDHALSKSTVNRNTGIGDSTLREATTGGANVAIGYTACRYNQTGIENTTIGDTAGSGASGFSHSYSVMIGSQSGAAIRTGQGNTFVGAYTGAQTTTGGKNIFLGYSAGYRQSTLSNLLIVDNATRASATVEQTNAILYGVMASTPASQTLRVNAVQSIVVDTATNNAALNVLDLQSYVTSAGSANGFGVSQTFTAETATDGTYQRQGRIYTAWNDATNVSRKADLVAEANDSGGAREGWRIRGSGTAPMLGFYGVTPVIRATNAGAAGAFVANTSGIADDTATFGGYTLGQIVQALINIGILT